MNYAIIENNKIVNVAVSDSPLFDNWIELNEDFTIGDLYEDNMFKKKPKDFEEEKQSLIAQVKDNYNELSPVTVNDITYNGGDSSASAIAGAVQLAQELGETSVKLWDIDNVIREYTFEEAMSISAQIAKTYRDAKFAEYQKIQEIKACETLEELDAIEV